MKTPKWLLWLVVAVLFNACLPGRFIVYNFADIKDHKKFPSRPLTPSPEPFRFVQGPDPIDPKLLRSDSDKGTSLSEYLKSTKTVSFLIIMKDTVLFEYYNHNYTKTSIVPSFSMAKSVTSALIGCALQDGLITSIDDPVEKYLPEWKGQGLERVTVRHLLQMTSGTKFNESYINPFGDAAKYYYGRNLRKYIAHVQPEVAPGTRWQYHSGNTQVLGAILDRVLAGKTVTQYLQEKIWTPIGMENPASWSIDKKKNGLEKTFCCLNATTHDFAKFGRLYLKKGNWNGRQVIPEEWVKASTNSDRSAGGTGHYQYQWWLGGKAGYYFAEGILGQFIFVHPQGEIVIVRLGKDDDGNYEQLMESLANGLARRVASKN